MPNRMKLGCAFTNSLVSGMKSSRLSSNTYTQVQWRLLQHTMMHRVVIVFLHMYVPSYTDTLAHIYLSKPPYPCIVYPPSLGFCLLKVCKSPLMHALYMCDLTHTRFMKNQHTVHLVSLHAHVQVQWHMLPEAPNAHSCTIVGGRLLGTNYGVTVYLLSLPLHRGLQSGGCFDSTLWYIYRNIFRAL